jgi:hypothetical protein
MTDDDDPRPDTRGAQLAAALSAFQTELPHVEATETADAGQYKYKYAGLGKVSRIVMPLLGKHGLAFSAYPTVTLAGKFVLRYKLLHKSGEYQEGEYPLSGGNAQAIGSAITYARRYSLLSVTGVSPDQDDDDAAENIKTETQFPETPTELQNERERVRGAWAFQYGEFVQKEAEADYHRWSEGGSLTAAGPAELRRYAAYLSNLPKADAGNPPPASGRNEEARAELSRAMSNAQRGKLFKLMTEVDLTEKGEQLAWVNRTLGREYESRTQITAADAKTLIDGLQAGIDAPSEPA